MKHFFTVAALFLGLVSCSEEQDLVIVEPLLINVLDDEVYSKIDQNDFKSYIRAFIKDAERHGVILGDINIEGAVLDLRDQDDPFAWGAATTVCDPNNLTVIWNTIEWEDKSLLSNTNIRKLGLFWHEFGHTILGLRHTCSNGHIMTSSINAGCVGEELEEGVSEINITHLEWSSVDEVRNFQRAVDDMFAMKDQHFYDCRTSFTSKGQTETLSCTFNF